MKMLKGRGNPTNFEDIQPEINAIRSDTELMADVVAKYKGEIFDILKNNLAEEKDDEKLLKKLKDSLVDKKKKFIDEFGYSDPKLINFQNDKDIVDLRTMKINNTISGTPANDKEKKDMKKLIRKTLIHLDSLNKYDKTKKTLFMAITKPINDIDNNIKTQIGKLLESKDAANIGNDLDKFITNVYKRGSAFSVAGGKLYDKAPEAKGDLQRKSSIRIAVYLYLLDNLVDNNQLTSDLFAKAKDIIENQIQKEESNKITGIYNVKKELEYVEPEYETLHDINTKDIGDIDLGTEKYESSTKKIEKELTSEYEHGLAVDLDKFVLESKKITTSNGLTIKMTDISGIKNKIEAARGKLEDIDLQVEIGGKNIVIGKLALNNKDRIGDAKFIFEMSTWSTISSKLSDAEIKANFPLEIKFGVQGIKKVKNPPVNGHVGLTRNLVIKLEPDDGGGPNPPPPPQMIGSLDDELDVNFSDMRQTIKDISDERAYTKHSKEYVDAINNKKTKFGRMLVSAKHAMFGDMFRLNKYKKLRRDINRDKTSLNLKGDWANVAHVHGQQDLRSVMELTESNYPTIYNQIDDLSYRFYEGTATMSESAFERELKKIFDSNDARALKRTLKRKGVSIGKSASDILMSVKTQKAQNKLSYQITQAVESALVGKTLPLNTTDQSALSNDITAKFKSFTNKHQLVPQLFVHYNKLANTGEQANLSDSYENIAKKMVSHLDSLTMIAAQSMTNKVKLNIKFLAKGHSTDHIEAKKGEKQKRWNPFSKIGGLMYGKGYRWRRFPIKLLATGGAAAAGTILLGPLAGIIGGSLLAGSLAAGKKAAQIQRKKQSVEKEYVKDRSNNVNFAKEKNMKELKYLENIGNYEDIKTEFDRILSQPGLQDAEKENLIGLLSRVIAGLDHQKKTGHNAFSIGMSGKSEIDREKNYNKAMSELHKYKELSLKRLQLEDVDIEEKDIREEDKYKSYRAGYKGDFKAFLKGFRKERRRATRKRGGKTAITYAAIGGLTLGLSEFLDWIGGTPGSVNKIDLGNADTLYNLGDYSANPSFSTDISTQLSGLPAGTTDIQVDYFAGVDGTPASSSAFNSTTENAQIADIRSMLGSGVYSPETIYSVTEQIDPTNITKLIDYAQTNGADIGNQHLFVARNLEGIHELLKEIEGQPKLKLDFNFDGSNSVIGGTSHIPNDRLTGINLSKIENIDPIPSNRGEDLRAGQGLYTEDNTHKG